MELRAQLNQARAERKLSAATLARQQQLAQRQLVSRQDLDTAATDLAVKEAQIGTIEARSNAIRRPRIRPKPTSTTPKFWRRCPEK